jgi:hypothetical protein
MCTVILTPVDVEEIALHFELTYFAYGVIYIIKVLTVTHILSKI